MNISENVDIGFSFCLYPMINVSLLIFLNRNNIFISKTSFHDVKSNSASSGQKENDILTTDGTSLCMKGEDTGAKAVGPLRQRTIFTDIKIVCDLLPLDVGGGGHCSVAVVGI